MACRDVALAALSRERSGSKRLIQLPAFAKGFGAADFAFLYIPSEFSWRAET
jgi:hypothetical protein